MTDRVPCASCGIPVPGADLVVVGDAAVCPRCYALTTPATLASRAPREPREPREPVDARTDRPPPRVRRLEASVREWAGGRLWWVRAPVVAWLTWILFRYWDAPWRPTLWKGIDLAIHEIGHILWSPLGEFMGMAGGTLTQLLVPVAAGVALYRQRDWFGVPVAVAWVGINCFEIAEYAGDAVARRLPLVSPSTANPVHDWSYMLRELGLLQHTELVAGGWLWAGRLLMGAGVAFGAWVLWVMATTPAPESQPAAVVAGGETAG